MVLDIVGRNIRWALFGSECLDNAFSYWIILIVSIKFDNIIKEFNRFSEGFLIVEVFEHEGENEHSTEQSDDDKDETEPEVPSLDG